jgi:indole-3-glycerol phosphate synthase
MVSVLGSRTGDFVGRARSLGLEPLVEAHDEQELETACSSGARLVGLNNRNLRTLEVDLSVSARLLPLVPKDMVAVVESGIRRPEQVSELAAQGAVLFLVGESLLTDEDPAALLRTLLTATATSAESPKNAKNAGRGGPRGEGEHA